MRNVEAENQVLALLDRGPCALGVEHLAAALLLKEQGRIEQCGPLYRHVERDPFTFYAPTPTLPHACCGDARALRCVCAYAYECPTHGAKHIGTHD